jgi:WD40 repeat protein
MFCYICVEGGSGVLTESAIIIWKQKTDQDAPDFPSGDTDNTTKEQWLGIRVLRGHMEDIYDLSWSPDSLNLISGSVDNSAIIWDVHKGIWKVVIVTFIHKFHNFQQNVE